MCYLFAVKVPSFVAAFVVPTVVLTVILLVIAISRIPQTSSHIEMTSSLSVPVFPFERANVQELAHGNATMMRSIKTFERLAITDYTEWHALTRNALEIALAEKSPKHPPRLLVVRSDLSLTHGLGDRFRGIVSAYFIAVLSRRLLLIDWTAPIPLTTVFISPSQANFTYDPRLLPSVAPYNDSQVVSGNYYYQTDTHHVNTTTLFLDSVPLPNVTRWFTAPEYRRQNNFLLHRLSRLHPLPPCVAIPLVLRNLFQSTPELQAAIRQRLLTPTLQKLISVNNEPYIALHARLGYGLGELEKDARRFDLQRAGTSLRGMARCFVDTALAHSNQYSSSSAPQFFLATDTPEFQPLVASELAARLPTATLAYVDVDVKHLRDLSVDVGHDVATFMNTFLDLFLMSSATSIINLRSGFSDLAVWMGALCNQYVVTHDECAEKYGII